MAAYELTSREKDVTRLVLRGETTTSIAASLFVSPQTVQQHLKSIFEKTGVRSRRDLVGKVFLAHYEPRVRDNERRAQTGPPVPRRPGNCRAGTSLIRWHLLAQRGDKALAACGVELAHRA
jgi:DNA-binding CsgD family transcriptional regulator